MKNIGKKIYVRLKQLNLTAPVVSFLVRQHVYKKFLSPGFTVYNERPIEYRFVFEQLTELKPKTILDVGTGLSALPSLMANCGARVVAIDNVTDYWANGMLNNHYHIIDDDITDSKLQEQFDMVTCISTLEHIRKCEEAVQNMFRLTVPGGYVVLTFPYNERERVENVYALPGSEVKGLPPFQTRAYSRKDLERWAKENGGTVVKQEYWQFFTGDYWTTGTRLPYPKQTSATETHQISCVVFQKK
jgi:2-polyprenyl-3-methyl-5-hydroxy-6-metoxy-1,4-benzoquinol methylase